MFTLNRRPFLSVDFMFQQVSLSVLSINAKDIKIVDKQVNNSFPIALPGESRGLL